MLCAELEKGFAGNLEAVVEAAIHHEGWKLGCLKKAIVAAQSVHQAQEKFVQNFAPTKEIRECQEETSLTIMLLEKQQHVPLLSCGCRLVLTGRHGVRHSFHDHVKFQIVSIFIQPPIGETDYLKNILKRND